MGNCAMQQQLSKNKSLVQRKPVRLVAQKPLFEFVSHELLQQAQQTIGNHGLLSRRDRIVQTKLKIGAPGDKYEQEADQVADTVMRMPEQLQQQEEEEDERLSHAMPMSKQIAISLQRLRPRITLASDLKLQKQGRIPEEEDIKLDQLTNSIMTKATSRRSTKLERKWERKLVNANSSGAPIPHKTKKFMEYRFGNRFSSVRLHTDGFANAMCKGINAKAFTNGFDIYFASGQWKPHLQEGQRLLAHELVHVLQQTGNRLSRKKTFNNSNLRIADRLIESPRTTIQRVVFVAGKEWKEFEGKRYINKLVKQKKVARAEKKEIQGILSRMILFPGEQPFRFANEEIIYHHLRRRYWLMKGIGIVSPPKRQGRQRCCNYPGRFSGRVNKAAKSYWNIGEKGRSSYYFELNEKGRKEADKAIITLFKKQPYKKDRTLFDCERAIVALHFFSMMKTLGASVFRESVKNGKIKVKIASKSPKELFGEEFKKGGLGIAPGKERLFPKGSLRIYRLRREINLEASLEQLIPGDHVYFKNHKDYLPLLKRLKNGRWNKRAGLKLPYTCPEKSPKEKRDCPDIWTGEHAVYLGKENGVHKFQGHGTGIWTIKKFVSKLVKSYNCHVDLARNCKPPLKEFQKGTARDILLLDHVMRPFVKGYGSR
jgi:hypothetical protein